jgi:hypothetical protein
MGIEKFFFQVLNVVIIYAKLPFERPIRDASLTLQEVENLSDDIVKFHHRLPTVMLKTVHRNVEETLAQ